MKPSGPSSPNSSHEKDTQKAKKHPWPARSILAVIAAQLSLLVMFRNYEIHPNTRDMLVTRNRFWILAFTITYTLVVTRIGPAFMRHRKPMELRTALYVYNALQIVTNTYMFLMAVVLMAGYNWRCEPIPATLTPDAKVAVHLCNLYFWLKVSDLLDTVFFVLRKKDSQVSFLHVYHHSIMVWVSWHGLACFPGGQGLSMGFFNTITHSIMYAYYLYSLMYPGNIWWKKFITQIQIVQQASIILYLGQLIFHNPCGYPLFPATIAVLQTVFVMVMFIRFYWRTYIRKTPAKVQ